MTENEIALIILSIFEILILSLFVYVGIKVHKAKDWVESDGLIIYSDIETRITTGRNGGKTYRNKIFYKYSVSSTSYTGKCMFFGDFLSFGSYLISRRIKDKYKLNSTVTLYYNPEKPQESVLCRGFHINIALLFLVNFVVVAIIVLVLKNPNSISFSIG